jgi:plastocyanin
MKRWLGLMALTALAAVTPAAKAQDTFTILVTDLPPAFTPSEITIIVGDRIVWAWLGGIHTVTADDSSFDSGLHSSPFRFRRPFLTVGDVFYHCQVHGGAGGIGQSGVIHVLSGREYDDEEELNHMVRP